MYRSLISRLFASIPAFYGPPEGTTPFPSCSPLDTGWGFRHNFEINRNYGSFKEIPALKGFMDEQPFMTREEMYAQLFHL